MFSQDDKVEADTCGCERCLFLLAKTGGRELL